MTAITISAERVALVKKVVDKWLDGFSTTLDSDAAVEAFLAVYDPEIQWSDHAFHVRRQGHSAIIGLQKSFTWCNQPLKTDVKNCEITVSGASLEVVWRGRMANDIVRPDGEVAVKASGRCFDNHVNFILNISDEGKITRINEYYNKHWDLGIEEEHYKVIIGASMKS